MEPHTLEHRHVPLYRVVRKSFADPLDASFSRGARDNRWNGPDFAALYCCCSEKVARAVTLDVLAYAGLLFEELEEAVRPQLAEVDWVGELVDATSPESLRALGLPARYPRGVDKELTREIAGEIWNAGHEGIVGRSPSLARIGFDRWQGSHEAWGEIALFPDHLKTPPQLVRRRDDLEWLSGVSTGR